MKKPVVIGMYVMTMLDAVADSVNPALAIVAILVAVQEFRTSRRAGLAFTAATALGLAAVYAVMALDRAFQIWERWGGDYSTHTAFATSVVLSLIAARPRWKFVLLAIWAAYLILILVVGYHTALDVLTAAAVAIGVTLLTSRPAFF